MDEALVKKELALVTLKFEEAGHLEVVRCEGPVHGQKGTGTNAG